jgi:hypothetical protein
MDMPSEYRAGFHHLERIMISVGSCVVPLYKVDVNKALQFVGSSIFCKRDNVELLFTARHVVEQAWPDRLWYPHSNSAAAVLPCDGFHAASEQSEDYCATELTSNLPMWSPFPYDNIDVFQTYKEYQHLLVGYPGSFTKGSTRNKQKLKLQGYLTSPAPDSEYARLGANPSKELVVLFKKEKVYDESHSYTNFPNPNGMSGGAVFQFNENIPELISLVGMMTRWDSDRKNAIIATRFEAVKGLFTFKKIV